MAIIPLQKKDFDFLEWECINPLFTSMNFREPRQGESYWRVPGFITINEAQIMIDKINGPSQIQSTVPIDEDEMGYGTIQSTVPVDQDEEIQATVPIAEEPTFQATVPIDQDDEDGGENNYGGIQSTVPIDQDEEIQATVPIDQDDEENDYADIPSRMGDPSQRMDINEDLDPMGLLNNKNNDEFDEIEYE